MADPEISTASGALAALCTYDTSLCVFLTLLSLFVYITPYNYLRRILVEVWFSPLLWILSDMSMSFKLVGLGTLMHSLSLRAFSSDPLNLSPSHHMVWHLDSDFTPDHFKQSPCVRCWARSVRRCNLTFTISLTHVILCRYQFLPLQGPISSLSVIS